ncbi:MAG: LamG domain-containing protein [Deltaproteobacteria bacterium]|nr:MAG: LamG domain-containing protein [Deltaproteobacteria bacterium]
MVLAFDGLGFILSASLYVAGVDREATGIHLLHDLRRLGGGALVLVAAQGLARGGEPGRRRMRGVLFVSALFGIESLALAVDGTFWRPADAVGTIAWIAALAYAYRWLLGRPAMRAQFAANEVAVETAAGRRFATIVLTLAALIAIVTARTELAGRRVTASRRDALAREQSEHAARIAAGEPAIRVPFDGSPADAGPYHFPVTVGGLPARFEPGARGQAIVLDGQTNWIELDPYLAIDARVSLRAGATLEVRFAPDDATASVAPAPMELATVSGGGNNLALELYLARGSSEILGRILGDPSTISVRGWAPASPGAKPWNHGAVVYDGTDGTLTVFANGKRIGQATGAPKDREWFPISFSIGGWSGSRARFRGRLDDVLLYDYPRSEAEIEADAGDR